MPSDFGESDTVTEEYEWFRRTPEETLERLNSSENGLSSEEANQRLFEYGPNELEEADRISPFRMFLEQFANPMVIILLFAIIISVATVMLHGSHEEEGFIDAFVISAIVLINAIFGFVQEYRSEQALEALKDLSAPMAIVKRDGEWIEIEARNLVPGDIVSLEAGDIVPADARLLTSSGLATDEAALTGESLAVHKRVKEISSERPALGDMLNLVFQGSIVSAGKGTAVITSTGMKTEFGKIAQLVQQSEQELTPLQIDLEDLGKKLGGIVLFLSIIVFAALVFVNTSYDWTEALFVAIAVAVAAIPEGLPAVVTVTLAIGVSRMVKKNAIVRRLPSVESLGSTTVICSDKTGTITKNEMTVRHVYLPSARVAISGIGYSMNGQMFYASEYATCVDPPETVSPFNVAESEEMRMLLKAGQICSTTKLAPDPENPSNWKILGDPTEGALLVLAEKGGLRYDETASEFEELAEFSFDSTRKRMTTIVRDRSDGLWAFVKGAPEVILEKSSKVIVGADEVELSEDRSDDIRKANITMASCAMRVLGLAYKRLEPQSADWVEDEVEVDLVFLGLTGMIDSPREGVVDAIAKCRRAGIRPIMITGDHALTALSIARSVGLTKTTFEAVTGAELSEMTDEELDVIVRERDVFARVAPEHKLRIVQALKRQNQVVAMTGDGVNDAPAIKTADVGISMGIRGAGVTKEASDLVLTDDNFSTIVSAIEVGREIYANIRKFVRFLLSANAGEVLLVFLMAMIGLPIPLTPVEILWINLVTDGPPALALGFDPPPKGIMDRCPRKPGSRMLDKGMVRIILVGGLLATFAASFVYLFTLWFSIGYIPGITGPPANWLLPQYADALKVSQTATFTTMVVFQLLWVWNCRDEWNPVWRTNIRESRSLIVAVAFSFVLTLMVLYTPLSIAFGTVP
ncbi:MAG: cation-translocating P-type ATPase, partial [Candidatus Thorarchaeota archaeon]